MFCCVCFFFNRKMILILTPHNFTLRWNSFSPSNTIWIFNLRGKTPENLVRLRIWSTSTTLKYAQVECITLGLRSYMKNDQIVTHTQKWKYILQDCDIVPERAHTENCCIFYRRARNHRNTILALPVKPHTTKNNIQLF